MRFNLLILIFWFLAYKINLLEIGDFTDILQRDDMKILPNLEENIFEKKDLLSQDQRMKRLLTDYDNKITQFNNNLIKIKTVKAGDFDITITNSCIYDLKETEKKDGKLPECENGEYFARQYVYSSIHFLLKSLVKKSYNSERLDQIIENTFDTCYLENKSGSIRKYLNIISLYRICFNNALKFYIIDLKTIIRRKMNEIRLNHINVKKLESELVNINSLNNYQ